MKTKFIVLAIFQLFLAGNIYAQDEKIERDKSKNGESQVENDSPDNFTMLSEERTRLTTAIPQIREKVIKLEEKKKRLPSLNEAEKEKSRIEKRLENEKSKKKPDEGLISSLEDNLSFVNFDIEDIVRFDTDYKPLKQELQEKQKELRQVESKINELLNRDIVRQAFKEKVTLVFGGLVGLVIIGFFWVAVADAAVRKSIFGGGAGIQFLTLFSLVIAIILFGITSILEAKELSALLGGLSGYILGRGIGKVDDQPVTS